MAGQGGPMEELRSAVAVVLLARGGRDVDQADSAGRSR